MNYSNEPTIVVVKIVPAISIRPVLETVDIPRPQSIALSLTIYHHCFISVAVVFYDNYVALVKERITQLLKIKVWIENVFQTFARELKILYGFLSVARTLKCRITYIKRFVP